MASGLYRLKANIPKTITSCIKHSTFRNCLSKVKWRTIVNIAINSGCFDDSIPIQKKISESRKSLDLHTLKTKEKGDWKKLTLEEKRALYRMSFSQPFCEVIDQPDDEWKLILAGTFTAMGLMTLGMYMWLVQSKRRTETFPGISTFQNKNKNEEMNLFYGKENNSVSESRN